MKLPWVSRAVVDEWVGEYITKLWDQLRATDERYKALLEKYHELKVNGASIPEPPKTLERPEFDPVMAAITAKAGPDRKLRAMMSAEAMRSRKAGIDDVEIIQAIEQGVTVDDEGGVVL